MNEHEFRRKYASLQHDIAASPDLKRKTLDAAMRPASSERRAPSARERKAPKYRSAPQRESNAGSVAIARRWALPAAACLVAGGAPALMNAADPHGAPGIAMSDAAATSGFAVRAYAADGSTMLELGADGTVVFDRTESSHGLGDDYATEGYFTGCLFRVEGDGISRVQMNVSSGKLYRRTVESFRREDEPARLQELLTTKPLNRGMGVYYGAYDEATILPFAPGTDIKNNPDALVGVELAKLYGATIDVAADDDPGIATGETSFGLWTNEGDASTFNAQPDPFATVIDQFEGQTLTVTVTFEDGHVSTQVIELHTADFLVDEGDPDDPNDSKLVPESIDPASLGENERSLHSLYGTVLEANHEPFPLPLDNANDLADTVMPAATLDRQDDTRPLGSAIDESAVHGEGDDIRVGSLAFGYPTVERLSAPPDGKTLGDFNAVVYGWFGNTAYVSKCSNEVFGYGFNDDGTLTSDDFTYVTATFDLTNESGETVEVRPVDIAEFLVVGENGQAYVANAGYDLDFETSGNALPSNSPQYFSIAAGDTVQVTILRVLSNRLADDATLMLAPTDGGGGGIIQAFAVGDQI